VSDNPSPSLEPPAEPGAYAWARVLDGLRALAGTPRCVIYAVPPEQAPRPPHEGSIYLRGSPAWRRFLAERRRLDTGEPALVLALRPLGERERLLIVDWGSRYANTLPLVEPRDPACDLTQPANPLRRALEAAAMAGAAAPAGDSPLARRLRAAFGLWTYWTGTRGAWEAHHVTLAPRGPEDTLAGLLALHLPVRFPQGAFDRALAELYQHERELFSGAVARARIPFRSRLGLPILHDPRAVDRALRRLVNEGRAAVSVRSAESGMRYGAGRPVPAELSAEAFERLLL